MSKPWIDYSFFRKESSGKLRSVANAVHCRRGSDDHRDPIKLGITLSGAATGGCYEAGVMDFFIEAMMCLQQHRQKEPYHDYDPALHEFPIEVDKVAGTSAGGITALLACISFSMTEYTPLPNHHRYGDAAPPNNPLFRTWVKETNLERLFDFDDLRPSNRNEDVVVKSILNSKFVDTVTHLVVDPQKCKRMPPWAGNLDLILTNTSLRGTPYSVGPWNSVISNEEKYRMRNCADYVCFRVTTDPDSVHPMLRSMSHILDVRSELNSKEWQYAISSVKATSAFPGGFPTANVKTPKTHYDHRSSNKPDWEMNVLDHPKFNEYAAVDGGIMNNDPFGIVEDIMLRTERQELSILRSDTGEKGEKYETDAGTHAVILVTPFPDDAADNRAKQGDMSLINMVITLLRILYTGMRFKHYALEEKNTVPKHFLSPFEGTPGVDAHPRELACGSLFTFGGMLDERFRLHDFQLGRANCQAFLRNMRDGATQRRAHDLGDTAVWDCCGGRADSGARAAVTRGDERHCESGGACCDRAHEPHHVGVPGTSVDTAAEAHRVGVDRPGAVGVIQSRAERLPLPQRHAVVAGYQHGLYDAHGDGHGRRRAGRAAAHRAGHGVRTDRDAAAPTGLPAGLLPPSRAVNLWLMASTSMPGRGCFDLRLRAILIGTIVARSGGQIVLEAVPLRRKSLPIALVRSASAPSASFAIVSLPPETCATRAAEALKSAHPVGCSRNFAGGRLRHGLKTDPHPIADPRSPSEVYSALVSSTFVPSSDPTKTTRQFGKGNFGETQSATETFSPQDSADKPAAAGTDRDTEVENRTKTGSGSVERSGTDGGTGIGGGTGTYIEASPQTGLGPQSEAEIIATQRETVLSEKTGVGTEGTNTDTHARPNAQREKQTGSGLGVAIEEETGTGKWTSSGSGTDTKKGTESESGTTTYTGIGSKPGTSSEAETSTTARSGSPLGAAATETNLPAKRGGEIGASTEIGTGSDTGSSTETNEGTGSPKRTGTNSEAESNRRQEILTPKQRPKESLVVLQTLKVKPISPSEFETGSISGSDQIATSQSAKPGSGCRAGHTTSERSASETEIRIDVISNSVRENATIEAFKVEEMGDPGIGQEIDSGGSYPGTPSVSETEGEEGAGKRPVVDRVEDDVPIKLGITLSGAATGGCYEAGFMDFMIEALRCYSVRRGTKEDDDNPDSHHLPVCIDKVGGTSAGGITGLLACASFSMKDFRPLPHDYVHGDKSYSPEHNPLFNVWVKLMNMEELFDIDDLKPDRKAGRAVVKSTLNSEFFDKATNLAFEMRFPFHMPSWAKNVEHHAEFFSSWHPLFCWTMELRIWK
ncbi:Patatin-like phospholipase [Gracilaria domingensis]|nr:Patatin-like phospholipase [Gracilaria domingensis]